MSVQHRLDYPPTMSLPPNVGSDRAAVDRAIAELGIKPLPQDPHAAPQATQSPKQRCGDAKVPLGYVPPASVIYEALALADGARKYGPFDWRDEPVEAMTYIHACLRHLYAWVDGEALDSDSGKPHLGHAKACLGILIDSVEHHVLIDNRPPASAAPRLLKQYASPPAEPGQSSIEGGR